MALHKGIWIDYKWKYWDESYEIPFPATILVDENGVVKNTFIDADIAKRLEPDTTLEWVAAL